MAKHRARRARFTPHAAAEAQPPAVAAPAGSVEAFTFGEPEVIQQRSLLDYVETAFNGRWYEPPVSFPGLARAFRSSPHHGSAIFLKRNLLATTFVPHRLLSHATFAALVLDFLVLGNAFVERERSMFRTDLGLRHSLGLYTRRGKDGRFFFARNYLDEHEFAAGSVFQLREDDLTQEVYGVPEYLSALQSAHLNEAATMFRRRYYENGSHAGFILYLSDAQVSTTDVDTLREQLRKSKGPGNFRNLFLHSPGGKADGLKLIPISEIAAKDDFAAIKNTSMADVLASHRVPPGLLGIIPNNTGGFGNAGEALKVFMANEVAPLQTRLRSLNEWMGQEVVRFKPLELPA